MELGPLPFLLLVVLDVEVVPIGGGEGSFDVIMDDFFRMKSTIDFLILIGFSIFPSFGFTDPFEVFPRKSLNFPWC